MPDIEPTAEKPNGQANAERFLMDVLGFGRLIEAISTDDITRDQMRAALSGTMLGTSGMAYHGIPVVAKIRPTAEAEGYQKKFGKTLIRPDLPFHFLSASLLRSHSIATATGFLEEIVSPVLADGILVVSHEARSTRYRIEAQNYDLDIRKAFYGQPAIMNFSFNSDPELVARINRAVTLYHTTVRPVLKAQKRR